MVTQKYQRHGLSDLASSLETLSRNGTASLRREVVEINSVLWQGREKVQNPRAKLKVGK